MTRLRVLSGIQPSGTMHLGNYFGAIRTWVRLQDEYDAFYCIVDLHALTSTSEASLLRRQTLDLALDLLACGIDPERSVLFVQSAVPEHTELFWIFCTLTGFGDLARMTQFKQKSDEGLAVTAGLFAYPVLQAADILLYKAEKVPVGDDQLQHLELTRRIARSFNHQYGQTFRDVTPLLSEAPRVRSLADPGKKMSKSLGDKHVVGLFDDEKRIRKKIRSAVTDMGLDAVQESDEMSPGVANLFLLLRLVGAEAEADDFAERYRSGRLLYRDLKFTLADRLMEYLAPLRARRQELAAQPHRVEEILAAGRQRAAAVARETMAEIRERVGLFPHSPHRDPST